MKSAVMILYCIVLYDTALYKSTFTSTLPYLYLLLMPG